MKKTSASLAIAIYLASNVPANNVPTQNYEFEPITIVGERLEINDVQLIEIDEPIKINANVDSAPIVFDEDEGFNYDSDEVDDYADNKDMLNEAYSIMWNVK